MSDSKVLLLIDGNNLFHRAYHALPPLTSKSGETVNAVYGFSNMLLKAVDEVKPTYVACAFDTKAATFRHVEFEAYKAQRVAPPPDLYPQLPIVKRVLDSFGIKYFEKEGYEADDLLATIAVASLKSVGLVIILSGDRDLLQLVDGNIKVQAPGWNLKDATLFGAAEVREKYGLDPEQMVDYKSLIGDPSDNIPGVTGIGPKTAATLLSRYRTLETLFDHLDEVPTTTSEKLKIGKDLAFAAKKLVKLDLNVQLDYKIDELKFDPDWQKVKKIYEELGFKSIVNKLPGSVNHESQTAEANKDDDSGNQLELV